jgi:hypothetical protein
MANTVSLYTSFAVGMMDYITRHNSNYSLIEQTLNNLLALIGGQMSGSNAQVAQGLQWIFDRTGVVGIESYDFPTGDVGTDIVVAAGAYWNAGTQTFLAKVSSSTISMSGQAAGTYYVILDASGNPSVSTTPGAATVRQFVWDGSSNVSAKALYSGVSILFSGYDYALMLVSATLGVSFQTVAARLENIEGDMTQVSSQASSATPTPAMGGTNLLYILTAQAEAMAVQNPTGCVREGQKLAFRFKDNGTAQPITWGSAYRGVGVPLPSTTVPGKVLYMGGFFNKAEGFLDIVAGAQQS